MNGPMVKWLARVDERRYVPTTFIHLIEYLGICPGQRFEVDPDHVFDFPINMWYSREFCIIIECLESAIVHHCMHRASRQDYE